MGSGVLGEEGGEFSVEEHGEGYRREDCCWWERLWNDAVYICQYAIWDIDKAGKFTVL